MDVSCRIGYLSGSDRDAILPPDAPFPWAECRNRCRTTPLHQIIHYLYDQGARNIAYFGSCLTNIFARDKDLFLQELHRLGLPSDESRFQVFDPTITLKERLEKLRNFYATSTCDGLILELQPYLPQEFPFDFYDFTGIPTSVHLITSVCNLLQQPALAKHAHVYHLPCFQPAYQLTSFLLSNQMGHHLSYNDFTCQTAREFFELEHLNHP